MVNLPSPQPFGQQLPTTINIHRYHPSPSESPTTTITIIIQDRPPQPFTFWSTPLWSGTPVSPIKITISITINNPLSTTTTDHNDYPPLPPITNIIHHYTAYPLPQLSITIYRQSLITITIHYYPLSITHHHNYLPFNQLHVISNINITIITTNIHHYHPPNTIDHYHQSTQPFTFWSTPPWSATPLPPIKE